MDYKEMVCESSSDTEEKFRGIWLQNIRNTACDILHTKIAISSSLLDFARFSDMN